MPSALGIFLPVVLVGSFAPTVVAQSGPKPLGRSAAIALAEHDSPRLGAAHADTALAAAMVLSARLWADPSLAASYTKSVPRWHLEISQPFDLPGVRSARIGAGEAGLDAAELRLLATRQLAALTADTAYTRSVEARARSELSSRAAAAADELLRIATLREQAGDASSLDVALARISSGRISATAATDSLDYIATILSLQEELGERSDSVLWVPVDSIEAPTNSTIVSTVQASPEAKAATASVRAAELEIQSAKRSRWSGFALLAGIEFSDPTGSERGVLPVVGLTIPLPLVNHRRGEIAQAAALHQQATAERQSLIASLTTTLARTRRARSNALELLKRDGDLLDAANRVESMTTEAYREGEANLSEVIVSQQTAVEVEGLHLSHLADAAVADAVLRYLGGIEGTVP